MNNLSQRILYYANLYHGDWKKIGRAIKENEPYETMNSPYRYTTIADKDYPLQLRRLRYPPWILFYKGHLEHLSRPSIGIVGARNCSDQALQNTKDIVSCLNGKYCIVSGLAKGIDAQAHRYAHCTAAYIGCGIDGIYPACNRTLYETMARDQLILSEYPMGVKPYAWHFPWRNRLIAASVEALIVIEATYKSGTMLTVNECLELSVPVYCLPTAFGNSKYPGCNALIQAGAELLADLESVQRTF